MQLTDRKLCLPDRQKPIRTVRTERTVRSINGPLQCGYIGQPSFQLITVEQDGHGRKEHNVKNTILQRLNDLMAYLSVLRLKEQWLVELSVVSSLIPVTLA